MASAQRTSRPASAAKQRGRVEWSPADPQTPTGGDLAGGVTHGELHQRQLAAIRARIAAHRRRPAKPLTAEELAQVEKALAAVAKRR